MASNNKGVVTKNKFKFRLEFDAMCVMEEETEKTVVELVHGLVSEAAAQGGLPSVLAIRQWIRWAMLSEEPDATLGEAQAKCREMGLHGANELLAELLVASKLVAAPSDEVGADVSVDTGDVGNAPEADQEPVETLAST